MGKRRTADQIKRLLREADRDLAKGLTVSDVCRWLPQAGAEAIQVAPASPWENGYIESFHSRLRDEFLDREEFESVRDARAKGAWWRREYNIRPHSSLGYKTPNEFSDECDRGLHHQEPRTESADASIPVYGTPISGGPKNG